MNEALVDREGHDDFPALADAIRRVLTATPRHRRASIECARLAGRFGFDGFSYLLVRPGTALDAAVELATAIAHFDELVLSNDRPYTIAAGRNV